MQNARIRLIGFASLLLFFASFGKNILAQQEFAETKSGSHVSRVSKSLRKDLNLSSFYKKHVSAGGLPVLSSEKVQDAALLEAAYWIDQMLKDMPEVRRAMIRNKTRFVIMAVNEFTTDVPEHRDLRRKKLTAQQSKNWWDRRARGLGATPQRPVVSCGEENLLKLKGDPYRAENILIHEFAHAIHHMGLNVVDRTFDQRLKEIYEQAMKQGLWKGKYAATNRAEYWAESVQSYFGTNRENDHDHNHVDTPGELKKYDPRIYALVEKTFSAARWQYTSPQKRKHQSHLRTLDLDSLPSFKWPKRLKNATKQIEKLKKDK